MKRTLDDLRGALHDEADATAYPDVETLVAGARRRVAVGRRRRLAAFGAATAAVVVVVVVGFVTTTGSTNKAVLQPAELGPFSVNAGGADFPEYSQGMKRLTVLDAPMQARLKGSISLPTTVGRRLAVRMACLQSDSVDNVDDWNSLMVAKFKVPGGTGQGSCGSPVVGFEPIGMATAATTTMQADVAINVDPSPGSNSFKDSKLQVAIYEGVTWAEYHFPTRPAELGNNPGSGWFGEPGTVRVLGPKTAEDSNKSITFEMPYDEKLLVDLQFHGPGRVRLLIGGTDVSEQIGRSTPAGDKLFASWGYDGTAFQFPLDPTIPVLGDPSGDPFGGPLPTAAAARLRPGTPVTVTVAPQDFVGPDWRVVVLRR